MTALSVRHQRFTLRERETEQARRDAEWFASLPAEEKPKKYHYWHIEQKTKRSWRWVRDFYGTEEQRAKLWVKQFGTTPNIRLRCIPNRIAQIHTEGQ